MYAVLHHWVLSLVSKFAKANCDDRISDSISSAFLCIWRSLLKYFHIHSKIKLSTLCTCRGEGVGLVIEAKKNYDSASLHNMVVMRVSCAGWHDAQSV